jgi:hypothetical protein
MPMSKSSALSVQVVCVGVHTYCTKDRKGTCRKGTRLQEVDAELLQSCWVACAAVIGSICTEQRHRQHLC